MEYFIKTFGRTVRNCWEMPALQDYREPVMTYGELAEEIEKIHIYFRAAGLKSGQDCHKCQEFGQMGPDIHGCRLRRICRRGIAERLYAA